MAVYEANGQQYEIPDEVQGDKLVETLTMLTEQIEPPVDPSRPTPSPAMATAQQYAQPAATMVTGIVAEPLAGLAGLAMTPFGSEKAAATVEKVRQALTYTPKSEAGVRGLQAVGETLEPIAKAVEGTEQYLGEKGYQAAGPVGGAAGATTPTAAITALGLGPVRRALKVPVISKVLKTKAAKKLLVKAAPTIEGLRDTAKSIYKKIDTSGAIIKPDVMEAFSNNLRLAAGRRVSANLHPKTAAALKKLDEFQGARHVSDLDEIRQIFGDAAKAPDSADATMAIKMIDRIDNFMDDINPNDFTSPDLKQKIQVGKEYKDARRMWQTVRKSELLETEFSIAELAKSGWENGLRDASNRILKRIKRGKLKGYSAEEIAALKELSTGTMGRNSMKHLGKLGFSEGQAGSMLLASFGVYAGAQAGGIKGAVTIPLIGQVSRKLAQKLTRNQGELTQAIARAGKDGLEITKRYMAAVPKTQRSVPELTELFINRNIDVLPLLKNESKLIADAAFLASLAQSQKAREE